MRFLLSKWALRASLMAAAVLFAPHAEAAAPCAIESQAPKVVTTATYTLLPSDECAALVFTNPAPTIVTVNAPVAAGYSVAVIPAGAGGVTLQMVAPTTIFVNGASLASAIIPQGAGTTVISDGTNYFAVFGSPGTVSAFANLSSSSVYPGTFLGASPIMPLPNGIIQVTNPASIIPATRGDIMRACAGVTPPLNAAPGRSPAWWYVLDAFQRPYKVPLC